jgi:tRNA modification GTPase
LTETLAARLTPPAAGAIATLALGGPSAWQIVRGLFRPRSESGQALPEHPVPHHVWLGRFGAETADEVVLAIKQAEPVPWAEIHCHGGRAVVDLLLETVARRGARVCDAAVFLRLMTPADPLRHLARERLPHAPTVRTAAVLLKQCEGAFGQALQSILAALDAEPAMAERHLRELARRAPVGRHLVEPCRVTVAGAPNVGKSSLVNALAGYQRSIVSPTPGTTRDVVTTIIALDGWPVELADTAGLRQDAGPLEGQGIERARDAVASADLCLWVLDAGADPVWPDVPPERVLLVVNKMDLTAAWDLSRAAGAVHVSARTSAGMSGLCAAIAGRLIPDLPSPDDPVPFTPELCDGIEEAHRHLMAGRKDEAQHALQALASGVWQRGAGNPLKTARNPG